MTIRSSVGRSSIADRSFVPPAQPPRPGCWDCDRRVALLFDWHRLVTGSRETSVAGPFQVERILLWKEIERGPDRNSPSDDPRKEAR